MNYSKHDGVGSEGDKTKVDYSGGGRVCLKLLSLRLQTIDRAFAEASK